MTTAIDISPVALDDVCAIQESSLEISEFQRLTSVAAYYANSAARLLGYMVERATRPVLPTVERVECAALAVFCLPFAAVFGVFATGLYSLATLGKGEIQRIRSSGFFVSSENEEKRIGFLNACFQYPFSPLTGGVVAPLDKMASGKTRVEEIVENIGAQHLDVFLGVEFEDHAARVEFIRLMQEIGFTEFALTADVYGPALNSPGLIIASKRPLDKVEFIPFKAEDTSGLAKWARLGLLACKVDGLEIIVSHFNYGDELEDEKKRHLQLQQYMAPLIQKGAIGLGDLNTPISESLLHDLKLDDLRVVQGNEAICTNRGKIDMGRKDVEQLNQESNIDAAIFNPAYVNCKDLRAAQLMDEAGNLLSDHPMVVFTASRA